MAEIKAKREELEAKKDSFNESDLQKLERILPDSVDGIEFIVDINKIAKNNNLIIQGVRLGNENTKTNSKYGSLSLSFSIKTSYSQFFSFLADLEKSSRLFEIDNLIIKGNDTDIYDFQLSLKTFWLN